MNDNAVLPFEQPANFYYRRAVRQADRMSFLDSISFFRKALEKEPNNVEYKMDLADIYARMGCYEESNQVLLSILRTGQATPECFFGMGCNFYALSQYISAKECFISYRHLEPEGEYTESVEDMLEELDEFEEPQVDHEIRVLIRRAQKAFDQEDLRNAIQLYLHILLEDPTMYHARNNLALSYFCLGDTIKAVEHTALVLASDIENLSANCNMALFMHDLSKEEQVMVYIKRIMSLDVEELEDMYKICLTLCDIGRHDQAIDQLQKILSIRIYDKLALHYFAVANCHIGKYQEALDAWDRVKRIDPESPVAPYYIAYTKKVQEDGGVFALSYHYQLPDDEIRNRMVTFTQYISGSHEEVCARFESDPVFRELVRWSIGLMDDTFRYTTIRLLTFVGGVYAEEILRDFLLRGESYDDCKRDAMGALKAIGAKEPYLALLGGAMVEIQVSVLESDFAMTQSQKQTIHWAIDRSLIFSFAEVYTKEIVSGRLFSLWIEYLKGNEKHHGTIRKPQNWAAALLYVFCQDIDHPVDIDELCKEFQITPATLKLYARRLRETSPQKETI